MAKIVRYNGGTESYYPCSDPATLVRGKPYEVMSVDVRDWQTNYTLRGVEGSFNSCWFDDVTSKRTFIAISRTIPTVGSCCICSKLEFIDEKAYFLGWRTSHVKEVIELGNNIYHVKTCNSVYIIQVR